MVRWLDRYLDISTKTNGLSYIEQETWVTYVTAQVGWYREPVVRYRI